MIKKLVHLFFMLILCLGLQLRAQHTKHLDDLVFPCIKASEQINTSLQNGAKAILFNDNPQSLTNQLETINSFFEKTDKALFLIFDIPFNKDSSVQILQSKFDKQFFYRNTDEWPKEDLLQQKKIIALFADDLTYTSSTKLESDSTYAGRFSADPLNKMVIFTPDSELPLKEQCLNCWRITGKVPNFILLKNQELLEAAPVIESINRTRRFKGEIKYKGEFLNEIRWKQQPALITPGKFSYPVTGYKEILSPYKNGYKITPGEIIHHTGMVDVTRVFDAFDSSLDDQLVMHLPFNKKIQNLSDPDWEKIITNNVEIVKDNIRGKVAGFSKNNSYIDYSKKNELNFDTPISIAVWIKPDSLHQYMGVVGLGSSFSLKLNEGSPDFTTANIKDHMVDTKLEIGKWHHVAVVFNPNSSVTFLLMEKKQLR